MGKMFENPSKNDPNTSKPSIFLHLADFSKLISNHSRVKENSHPSWWGKSCNKSFECGDFENENNLISCAAPPRDVWKANSKKSIVLLRLSALEMHTFSSSSCTLVLWIFALLICISQKLITIEILHSMQQWWEDSDAIFSLSSWFRLESCTSSSAAICWSNKNRLKV